MTTLPDFLLERIADDEAVAEAAVGTGYDLGSRLAVDEIEGHRSGVHIDPARVLAECEAKRRIVDECDPDRWTDDDEWVAGALAAIALRFLAMPYADHPDYREEWKP